MSDAAVTVLVAGLVQVVTTICGVAILWLKTREAAQKSQAAVDATVQGNAKVEEVHELVNGQKAEMLAEITALKGEVARLKSPG